MDEPLKTMLKYLRLGGLVARWDEFLAEARQEFSLGLELYRARRFEEAGRHFLRAVESWPGLTSASVFLGRCRAMQETPPPPDWDAVFRPDAK